MSVLPSSFWCPACDLWPLLPVGAEDNSLDACTPASSLTSQINRTRLSPLQPRKTTSATMKWESAGQKESWADPRHSGLAGGTWPWWNWHWGVRRLKGKENLFSFFSSEYYWQVPNVLRPTMTGFKFCLKRAAFSVYFGFGRGQKQLSASKKRELGSSWGHV